MADQNADRLDAGLLPVLVKAFPKALFPDGLSCRPLRVGIFGDLDAVLPREIDRAGLKLSKPRARRHACKFVTA
jgi:hypothetical protein